MAEGQHVLTLVLYLGAVAENLGSDPRTRFCRRWASDLESIELAARDAVGAAGEWIDERAARRREAAGGARG